MNEPALKRQFSPMYSALVQHDGDVRGLVAYAIYKQTKRDFILATSRQSGRAPDGPSLQAFEDGNRLDGQLARYRKAADDLLLVYHAGMMEKLMPSVREQVLKGEVMTAVGRIAASGSFGRQLAAGIAAAFAYTLLLIAIALVLRYADIDLVSIWMAVRGS